MPLTECTCKRETAVLGLQFLWKGLVTNVENIKKNFGFGLTAMPGSAMLPFMMLELFSYGLLAGLLKDVKLPSVVKVLAVQVGGRAIRALAILFAVYVIGSNRIPAAVIINSIKTGMIGIVLQWALIPLILYRVNSVSKEQ